MKIGILRLCTLTVISLFSLFAFAAQAGAQDNFSKQQEVKAAGSGPRYRTLYSFCHDPNCTDGATAQAGLIQDAAGNLYGTTVAGGNFNGFTSGGVVFKLDTTGQETVLYSFCAAANCAAGWQPAAGVIQNAAGNLYGTTVGGGSNLCAGDGCGTVFKLDTTGQETVLYSFCSAANCADGYEPRAGLIQDAAGNLYGTTLSGGNRNSNCNGGSCGTVFKLDTTGQETVLYNFCSAANCADGWGPEAGLIQDAAGNLYGTTENGGNHNSFCPSAGGFNYGCGTVFELDTTGQLTVLYRFCSAANCTDGLEPTAGLIQDAAGNLYGTTSLGGNFNRGCFAGCGTVFKLDTTGQLTVLHSFCSAANCADGLYPYAGLIQDVAGNLYGTTYYGGANPNWGTVFKVDRAGQETVLHNFGNAKNDGGNPRGGLIEDAAGNLYGTTSGTVFEFATRRYVRITLTSSPNPSFVNQPVTLAAVVSGAGATPTGSVTFKKGRTVLGTVPLANGQASLRTAFTKSGTATILSDYSGDLNYKAGISQALSQVVNQ